MNYLSDSSHTRFIGSSNLRSAQYALEELRRLLPDLKSQYLEPNEIFLFQTATPSAEVLQQLRQREPIFLRHVQPVEYEVEIDRTKADFAKAIALTQQAARLQPGQKVAVQVRRTQGIAFDYTAYGVKEAIDPILVEQFGVEPVVRAADWVISIYLSRDRLYWGLSHPAANLSDWSGGIIRFQTEAAQISRAKFKLLEAETRFQLDFGKFHRALDLGAAPGGWTSLLLERGLQVVAVDPAALHPSLQTEPQLTHFAQNADTVIFPERNFDLLVCDMNWSFRQMAKLVARLLPTLERNGIAIITVKLLHKKPFQTVKETLEILGTSVQLIAAKQLFHNRDELTLYLSKLM